MTNQWLHIIVNQVLVLPPHDELVYPKDEIPHPKDLGFREDVGEPVGQVADYRLALRDGKSIHARDYGGEIGFHWDKVHPGTLENCIEHLRRDSPGLYTLSCSLTGGSMMALSTLRSKRKDIIVKSFLVGAIVGAIFGALTAEWE